MTRPQYPWEVPPGFELYVHEDEDWRVLRPGAEKRCRRMVSGAVCPTPAVAELDRGKPSWKVRRPNWYAYCADHMYGRWVEDGRVFEWRLRRVVAA